MTISKTLIASGIVWLALASVLILVTSSPVGVTFAVITAALGALALGAAFALRIGDPVPDEIDRWEADWHARWSPVCPVHGEDLCITSRPSCPPVRQRTR